MYFPRREYPFQMMLEAFSYSVKRHMPETILCVITPDQDTFPELPVRNETEFVCSRLRDNYIKMREWHKFLHGCQEGEKVIFMDCDMLLLGDISSGFAEDFDFAFTKADRKKEPINTGTVFVRNTRASRRFIDVWLQICERMYVEEDFHTHWRKVRRYWGISQASLGYVLEEECFEARIKYLPLEIYNASGNQLRPLSPQTKVIHVKGGGSLHNELFYPPAKTNRYQDIVKLWKQYHKQAVGKEYGFGDSLRV